MRIAITGAGGLIGSALSARFNEDGHEVIRIGRYHASRPPDVRWSIPHAQLKPTPLEGLDAVIHLAGESVFGKWTIEKKKAIRDSRIDGTRLLASTLAGLNHKPKVLISASAIGFYGDSGDTAADESSELGEGFLPVVAMAWEDAAKPAADAGIRVVHPRFGIVLSKQGGALKQMLPLFRFGLGGRLGSGLQWMSWISLHDTVEAMLYLIEQPHIAGPVNFVAPEPVTNKDFTSTLAGILNRPAIFPAPPFGLRLAFGQFADEALLVSQRVEPTVLLQTGYNFKHATLQAALRDELV